jgi:hypothetical protein
MERMMTANSGNKTLYMSTWHAGTRVRFKRMGHPDFQQAATIIAALPNPSGHLDRQWYDVRFDNGRYGRFLERYLEPATVEAARTA